MKWLALDTGYFSATEEQLTDRQYKMEKTQKHYAEQRSQIQTNKRKPHDSIYLKIRQN